MVNFTSDVPLSVNNMNKLQTDLQVQIDKLRNIYFTKSNEEILEKYGFYYVDGVNGNDNNDGTTQSKAFKTLNPIWKIIKEGDIEIRIALAGGSTYQWKPYNITSIAIHIMSYGTGNVTITMPSDSVAFYQCHLNIKGTSNNKIILKGYTELYLDAGTSYFRYVELSNLFTLWGSNADIENCTVKQLKLRNCNCRFGLCQIGGVSAISSKITYDTCKFLVNSFSSAAESGIIQDLQGTDITILGSTNIDMTGAIVNNTFMRFKGGNLNLLAYINAQNLSDKLSKGIDMRGGMIFINPTRKEALANIAQTGYTVTDGGLCSADL